MMFNKDINERGFSVLGFTDIYQEECSIQKSSSATVEAIWLGIDKARPIIMASKVTPGASGWVDYPLPNDVQIATRMHITRDQARELAKVLEHFSDTGEVDIPSDK